MILTVTLNAALDVTYVVGGVEWDGVNRVHAVHRRAGGKGINVARVLAVLGEDVVVAGLAGGPTGKAVEADLAAARLTAALTPITGESRTTLTINDTATSTHPAAPLGHDPAPGASEGAGASTGAGASPGPPGAASPLSGRGGVVMRTALFNEPGPQVTPDELSGFIRTFRDLVAEAEAVVLSGSLPPGVPPDLYATLARYAGDLDVPVIVDADGAPLRLAPEGRPAILKPNAEELARALASGADPPARPAPPGPGAPPASQLASPPAPPPAPGFAEVLAGAGALRRAGARAVVVSMGPGGLVAVTPHGSWRARMPYHVPGNPTGAGDALVAGLAAGLARGTPWPDRLRTAAALGAAAVATPVAGEIDLQVFRAIRNEIGVEPCPS